MSSRYARGDVARLRTLEQLIFWNYIAHKKERLDLVVRLFLNDTSLKTLKGRNLCKKIFQDYVFHTISHKFYNLLHAVHFFPSSERQIVDPC